MNVRAIILGFALAVFLALSAYFNDHVITQTHLVGNHLPIGIFGVIVLLIMVVNPLAGRIHRRAPLGAGQLAIIAAIGLMACVWAGSNFYRTFISNMVYPANDMRSQTSWQSAQIMSYLPGGSPRIAAGHLTDWSILLDRLHHATTAPRDVLETTLAERLNDADRVVIQQATRASELDEPVRRRLLGLINDALIEPTSDTANTPFYALAAVEDDTVAHHLARRERALDTRRSLEARREVVAAQLAEQESRFAAELAELNARQTQLTETVEALNLQLGEQPDDARLIAELQRVTDERQAVRAEQEAFRQATAPTVRVLLRTGWQIEYYQTVAARAEQQANRAAVVALADGLILPAPAGSGLLLNDGFHDAFVTEVLVQGWDGDRALGLRDLGWWVWWPTIRTWGTVAILLTLSILFLSMIVHPQWSKRELLTYPVVRLVEAVTEPGKGSLPKVMQSQLFWMGFGLVLFIHAWNGLNAWFPNVGLAIPLSVNMSQLRFLFENIASAPGTWRLFQPTFVPMMIGFAYFLNKDISLSVGLALPTWALFGAFMVVNGVAIDNNANSTDMMPMFRFGANLGLAMMVLYVGRRYYSNVLASAFGLPRHSETPRYASWAMRGMLVCLVLSGWALTTWVGMDWVIATLFIGVVMVMSLIMARMNAETGLIFAQPWFMPTGVITALLGVGGIGPEAFFILAVATGVMMHDPRESAMPFFVNALNMADRVGKASPARMAAPLIVTLLITFVVAGVVTLYWQNALSSAPTDTWARSSSSGAHNSTALAVTELHSRGELVTSNQISGLERLTHAQPNWSGIAWLAGGAGIVFMMTFLRLRCAWWPLHPVIFIFWGTNPINFLAASFLMGWLIKTVVTKLAGVKGYHTGIPFMVGLIVGELLAAIGWTIVGATYYFMTGQTPVSIRILLT